MGRARFHTFRLDGDSRLTALGILLLAATLGCIAGSLVARCASPEHLSAYLESYLSAAREGRLDYRMFPLAVRLFRLPVLLAALGFTELGLLGIPAVLGWKGFSASFAVGCFLRVYGLKGLWAAGALFGVSGLVMYPALMLLALSGWRMAGRLLLRSREGRSAPAATPPFWQGALISALLTAACIPLEKWVAAPLFLAAMEKLV